MRVRWAIPYVLPWRHRSLLQQLVGREIKTRFQGSWLGLAWALLTPIGMLLVYTFVFRTVLKARWPGAATDSDAEFALQLFAGLLVYTWFSEVVGRASTLLSEQPNLVKKVVFPLQLLPWVQVLSAAFYALLNVLVLAVGAWLVRGELTIHVIAIPIVGATLVPVLLGLGWLCAALGVYFRDLGHIVTLILTPLLFLSPVFYPITALPEALQQFMWLNPIALTIDSLRGVLLDGRWPEWQALATYCVVTSAFALLAAAAFHKLRRGFADVL